MNRTLSKIAFMIELLSNLIYMHFYCSSKRLIHSCIKTSNIILLIKTNNFQLDLLYGWSQALWMLWMEPSFVDGSVE